MKLSQFIQQYRNDWNHLEKLVVEMPKNRSYSSVKEFQHVYQKVSRQLSYSQTFFPDDEVTFYLNQLLAKAHNILYQSQQSSWKQLGSFLGKKFPSLLIEQWKAVVIAMLLFAFGGLASFFAVTENPNYIYSILPEDMVQSVEPSTLGETTGEQDAPAMSAMIMTNNIQVAILAFAGGITFGLLTVYILIYNGLIIGALAAVFWNYGNSYVFWAYILPHGVIELIAIFIAGGAGLLMGYKLFVPGPFSRASHLKTQAKRSVMLMLGTVPIFIIAGIIEGFITPGSFSLEMKYAVAGLTLIGITAYILIGNYYLKKAAI